VRDAEPRASHAHAQGSYPTPSKRYVEALRVLFFCVPVGTSALVWWLFTMQQQHAVGVGAR
jgi:hypothetical protein